MLLHDVNSIGFMSLRQCLHPLWSILTKSRVLRRAHERTAKVFVSAVSLA
jgi:hypothetical protein